MTQNVITKKEASAVRRVVEGANAAIGVNDIEGVLAFFTADARMLPPEGPPIEGRDALRTFFEAWPVYKGAAASDIHVDGRADFAVATCAVSITHATSDGGESKISAKQMITLRKQSDGGWLMSAIIFNAEPAPAG